MQTQVIDLNKSPEIKDAVAGMEPGDEVCLHGTIKSLDDQTLEVTVEELSVPKRHKTEKEDSEKEEEETDETEKPAGGNEGSDSVPLY